MAVGAVYPVLLRAALLFLDPRFLRRRANHRQLEAAAEEAHHLEVRGHAPRAVGELRSLGGDEVLHLRFSSFGNVFVGPWERDGGGYLGREGDRILVSVGIRL